MYAMPKLVRSWWYCVCDFRLLQQERINLGGWKPEKTQMQPWVYWLQSTVLRSLFYSFQRVLRQNGSGQNGTDKMVWTKWYKDKMVLDKMAWTKWYGQNGTIKILQIKSSMNPLPLTIWLFHQSCNQFDAFSFFLCAYHLFVTFGC